MTQRAKSLKTAVFALVLVCLIPISAAAQRPSVTLTGKVTDSTGAGVPNAAVMIKTGNNLLAHARALTDGQGNFGTSTSSFKSSAIEIADGGQAYLIIRKAGYLPHTSELTSFSGNMGTISLKRDPLEYRIDSVMALMNNDDKIAQMTQPFANDQLSNPSKQSGPYGSGKNLFGSVLRGGDGHAVNFLRDLPNTLSGWTGNVKIPVLYGKDAVHGNAGIEGYTVFPHNIGLGAARDSALVRRVGEATAKEMWAAGINLNFSPAVSVAKNARWGRTYESYGQTAELSVQMGAAMVRGLQGNRYDAEWRVIATAKHFLGDGGTTNGKDRGNTAADDDELRRIHLPGYEAAVEQGVLSVMASFNQIYGVHQHIDSLRLTGWLKTELGFDGYVISDWLGIANSECPGCTGNYTGNVETASETAIRNAVNAGIDLAMEPNQEVNFINHLTALVNKGDVSQNRIDDAVRRILRAKFRAGLMDNIAVAGPQEYLYNTANKASAAHRAIAREAAAKSQVLLKNENSAFPLVKNAKIHVFGSHANNIGYQCGGWTIAWQGVNGNQSGGSSNSPAFDFTSYGNSILQGMEQVSGQSFTTAANADVIVYVTGEAPPYAEWNGDISNLSFLSSDIAALTNYRNQGKKTVTIFVSGRPREAQQLINASDAFLVAWLPGTEGGGVADVLFGDKPVTGRLPFDWPNGGNTFNYGFGLITSDTPPPAPTLFSKTHNSVTLSANETYEFSKDGIAWQTGNVFSDLTPEKDYSFYQRIAASRSVNGSASLSSPALTVKTESPMSVVKHERENNSKDGNIPLGTTITINEFSTGPNPVARSSGVVNFFWQGRAIENTTFSVYDASGNLVSKIKIRDKSNGGAQKRPVGSWNLNTSKGRLVSEGNYVVKGNIKPKNSKKEKVSIVLGVR